MKNYLLAAAVLGSSFAASAYAETAEWAIDASHSRVGFSVPHMVVSDLEGRFKTVTGKVALDEADLTKSTVEIEIDANSIDTEDAERDKHLKSPDFFDTAKHPKITFKATSIKKAGKAFKVAGNLTMRGVTKPVTLDVELSKEVKNPWGKLVRAAKVKGKLNRQDFGVSWNKALDVGGVVVGDDVTIDIQLELNK